MGCTILIRCEGESEGLVETGVNSDAPSQPAEAPSVHYGAILTNLPLEDQIALTVVKTTILKPNRLSDHTSILRFHLG